MMDNNWMVPFNTTQTQGNQLQLECIKTYCPREKASVYLISWILECDIQHKYIKMHLDVSFSRILVWPRISHGQIPVSCIAASDNYNDTLRKGTT